MRRPNVRVVLSGVVSCGVMAVAACAPDPSSVSVETPDTQRIDRAATFAAGFSEEVYFTGLRAPTTVRFGPDGRVFVAEKSGLVKVFASLTDTTPDLFA